MNKRRTLLIAASGVLAAPLAAFAQKERIYRIGILSYGPREAPNFVALFDELRSLGFAEGRNLVVAGGGFGLRDGELAAAAAALVNSAPDAIFSTGPLPTRAAQAATRTIPILAISDDMVADGLVPSMAHPGSNTTGVSILGPELDGKRQDILIEALPGARRMAALADPQVSTPSHLEALKEGARRRGVELLVQSARTPQEIAPAMNAANADGAKAINALATPLFFFNARSVIERAAALRLPAVYQWPEMVEQGGLLGYGPRITEVFRQLARLLAKVLRGAKPGDLPVEQPTKFELVVNLKTAKALGLKVPQSLLLRAEKVIE